MSCINNETILETLYDEVWEEYRIANCLSTDQLDAIDQNDFLHINASKLTKPDVKKPVYIRNGNNLTVYPSTITSLSCTYIKKPAQVVWGYVEISSVAKYDSSTATDFELHESDETTVVYKISGSLMISSLARYVSSRVDEVIMILRILFFFALCTTLSKLIES